MSRERFQRLLERRWVILPLSVAIALVLRAFWCGGRFKVAYSEYWLEPKLKAADKNTWPLHLSAVKIHDF